MTQLMPEPVSTPGRSSGEPAASGQFRADDPAPIIAPEGRPIVIGFVVGAAVVTAATYGGFYTIGLEWLAIPVGAVSTLLCLWCLWFFRDPQRRIPLGDDLVICPADGVVCKVDVADPPAELGLSEKGMTRICVFMNVVNVHVNRAPVGGAVERILHHAGKFFNASLDKASLDNERLSMVLRLPDGRRVISVQIAGLVARRIVCRVKEGAPLRAGERYGLIRFGSRVDVYLPAGSEPLVALGRKTQAGETVLAKLSKAG